LGAASIFKSARCDNIAVAGIRLHFVQKPPTDPVRSLRYRGGRCFRRMVRYRKHVSQGGANRACAAGKPYPEFFR